MLKKRERKSSNEAAKYKSKSPGIFKIRGDLIVKTGANTPKSGLHSPEQLDEKLPEVIYKESETKTRASVNSDDKNNKVGCSLLMSKPNVYRNTVILSVTWSVS